MPKKPQSTCQPAPDPEGRYIVAEVSKTWGPGDAQRNVDPAEHVGFLFERVCRVNAARGYRLHSWRLVSTAHDEPLSHSPAQVRHCIQETIVAVFEKEGAAP